MTNTEIIQMQGEVQMMKRDWWQLYKRGWQKHRDIWNRRWWIRFKWNAGSTPFSGTTKTSFVTRN
jgi:hypothetical protein